MDRQTVLAEFKAANALLEGHFILTSGRRSATYMQCARVLLDPKRAERLIAVLNKSLESLPGNIILAPAMGGIIVGYELARQRGCQSLFVERVDGQFELRRGFELTASDEIIIAEDVITTGLSTRECISLCQSFGATVTAVACLIDRTDGNHGIDVPLISLAKLSIPTYAADAIPPELAAIPPVKPGSRKLTNR